MEPRNNDLLKHYEKKILLGKVGQASDCAGAVVFPLLLCRQLHHGRNHHHHRWRPHHHTNRQAMKPALITYVLFMGLPALAGWEAMAPLPRPAAGFVAGVIDQKIIVAGGTNWPDGTKHWLEYRFWAYDPATNVWSEGPRLPHPLAYAAFATSNDRLYFVGGADGEQARREIYSLDAALKVTRHGNLRQPLAFASGAMLNGQMHIVGGTPDPDDWSRVLPSAPGCHDQ